MKAKLFCLITLALVLFVSFAMADDGLGVLPAADPAQTQAEAAVLKEFPSAVINYTLLDYDDGRPEWNIFFTDGATIGECELNAETYEIRKTRTYDLTDGVLTADKAVEKLSAEKGALTITEIELDWDDGQLWYEGDAELDGRRYEFEMTAAGRITEWERD